MSEEFIVVYDACVLYPATLRTLLMYLAMSNIFKARWSNLIDDEWMQNVLNKRRDLSEEKLLRVRDLMNEHVLDSVITGFEDLIPTIKLPDSNDRHVLAAAIYAKADLIVTFNLKDFPAKSLAKYKIRAIHPDDFIVDLFEMDDIAVIDSVRKHRHSLKNPEFSPEKYLDCLIKQKLFQTVSLLNKYKKYF